MEIQSFEYFSFLQKANELEAKLVLNLIAQLSFEPTISKDIQNDKEIIDYINDVLNGRKFDGQNQKFNISDECRQILWNIQANNLAINTKIQENNNHDQHVMISYNTASRDLCLQIKHQLESIGIKI